MANLLLLAVYSITLFISLSYMLIFLESGRFKREIEQREEYPSLSLIVPAYNEEDTLEMTVDSVLQADYPAEKEIIVVNDGSNDRTRDIAEDYREEGKIELINQNNKGKGAALNTGLDEASGELVGCVDADTKIDQDALKNIVSEMEEDCAGIASPMQVYKPSNLLEKLQAIEYLFGIFMRKMMWRIKSIHITPGPLSVYDREKIEEIGGFDPGSRVEDQEICFRLQKQHEKIRNARMGGVYTKAPSELNGFYKQRRRWYKGSFENLLQYRNMVLNPRYGDFGMFALPGKLAGSLISIFGFLLVTYTILDSIAGIFNYIVTTDLSDIIYSVSNVGSQPLSSIYWQVISLDYSLLTVLGALALFSLSMIYLTSRYTEESIRDIGVFPALIYAFWFFLLVGFLSLVALVEVIIGYETEW